MAARAASAARPAAAAAATASPVAPGAASAAWQALKHCSAASRAALPPFSLPPAAALCSAASSGAVGRRGSATHAATSSGRPAMGGRAAWASRTTRALRWGQPAAAGPPSAMECAGEVISRCCRLKGNKAGTWCASSHNACDGPLNLAAPVQRIGALNRSSCRRDGPAARQEAEDGGTAPARALQRPAAGQARRHASG